MADAPVFHVPRRKSTRQQRKLSSGKGAKYHKKSGVFATPAGFKPLGSGGTRQSVIRAAQVFLEQARKNAARFSRRIPGATYLTGYGEQQAMIVTDGVEAPNAAPFEFGERHPLFGNRSYWYAQPRRPYMSRAASNKGAIERSAAIYAEAEAAMLAEEHGYTE